MPEVSTEPWSVGSELAPVVKEITQEKINRYAEASGDHNPLHIDPAFAATTQFGGTIAHGMLLLAYISEMMTAAFGARWLPSGRLKVRFRAPARPGDTILTSGRIVQIDGGRVVCNVECKSQSGDVLVSGQAEVG
jgi:3-hydroxybutyryl-CoA dehydratase